MLRFSGEVGLSHCFISVFIILYHMWIRCIYSRVCCPRPFLHPKAFFSFFFVRRDFRSFFFVCPAAGMNIEYPSCVGSCMDLSSTRWDMFLCSGFVGEAGNRKLVLAVVDYPVNLVRSGTSPTVGKASRTAPLQHPPSTGASQNPSQNLFVGWQPESPGTCMPEHVRPVNRGV